MHVEAVLAGRQSADLAGDVNAIADLLEQIVPVTPLLPIGWSTQTAFMPSPAACANETPELKTMTAADSNKEATIFMRQILSSAGV